MGYEFVPLPEYEENLPRTFIFGVVIDYKFVPFRGTG